MRIIIRSGSTFAVKGMWTVSSYSVALDLSNVSTFTVPEELHDVEGDIVCCYEENPKYCGVISASSPKNGATIIQANPIINVLDREVYQEQDVADYTGGGIEMVATAIADGWTNQEDTFFKMAWLTTSYTGEANGANPEADDAGYYNLLEYIQDRIDSNAWQVDYTLGNNGVVLNFKPASNDCYIYDMTTGRHQLNEESTSYDVVSRITTHTFSESENTWSEADYYLFADGSYSTDPSEGTRVVGSWKHILDPKETEVEDTFGKNEHRINLSFFTHELPSEYIDHHAVRVKLPNGRIIDTLITGCCYSQSDNRYQISTGKVISTFKQYLESAFVNAKKSAEKVEKLTKAAEIENKGMYIVSGKVGTLTLTPPSWVNALVVSFETSSRWFTQVIPLAWLSGSYSDFAVSAGGTFYGFSAKIVNGVVTLYRSSGSYTFRIYGI